MTGNGGGEGGGEKGNKSDYHCIICSLKALMLTRTPVHDTYGLLMFDYGCFLC